MSFDYRIVSYDEIDEDNFDKFDVYIDDGVQPHFRIFRGGSDDGIPSGSARPCNFVPDDSDWQSIGWHLSSVPDFDRPGQTYDLRGKTIRVIFQVFSQEIVGSSGWYNTWVYIDNLELQPETTMTKSNAPPGPVHEGNVISYTISYANSSLITQTITLTDVLPFNATLIPESVSPPARQQGSILTWNLGDVPPGGAGQVFFKMRVALLPFLHQDSIGTASLSANSSPAYVLPVPIACNTTRFWANGITRQPPAPNPHTIQVQIPPGTAPTGMWLLMKGTNNISPTVEGQPAHLEWTMDTDFGAGLWAMAITPEMIADGQITVVTHNPRALNALFLFDADDPPFEPKAMKTFFNTRQTFSYTLDIPSVVSQTMDVILPFVDITYLTDDLQPDTRLTTVTVQFDDQSHRIMVNNPNLGNGLLMTQFPLAIGPLTDTITSTKVLTVTVDTQDSVYTLGPRVCRPVYIQNTAWLCSRQAGCIADTASNIPPGFSPPGGLYLPIILKLSS